MTLPKNKNISVSFRVWFFAGNEKFLGKGRVELLQKIEKFGSISSAAKDMKMSYRQAWQMISEINEHSELPLVEKKLGGKSGGGATLTDAGKKAISTFKEFEKKVADFIQEESKKIKI